MGIHARLGCGTEAENRHFSAMRARNALLFITFALTACASQADKQLKAVKSARSVLAEWALVEDQAAGGRAQAIYTDQMRELARDELKTDASELAQQPDAAHLLQQLRSGSPDATALKQADSALAPLEKRLEAS